MDLSTFQVALSPESYIQNIQDALDIMHQNIPRAIVQVVPYFDVSPVTEISDNLVCDTLHR